ncbi:MAG TPA: hypothetical protein VGK73_19670 [Polyangiaceae bacterium]
MSPERPLERVELVEEEYVASRGSAEITWRVQKNDGWVRPAGVPGARSERLERGAGVVWRTRIELELPRGTRLLRVESRPDARPASTLAHLTGGGRGSRRRTLRVEYRVGAGGALERAGDRD